MTYNIYHGVGFDGVLDLERIALVIINPDLLDVNMERSANFDILKKPLLRSYLNMRQMQFYLEGILTIFPTVKCIINWLKWWLMPGLIPEGNDFFSG